MSSSTSDIMSRSAFIIIIIALLNRAQSSVGFNYGSVQLRSYSDYVEQNGRPPMDSIIAVNEYEGVYEVDGVSIREGDVAVSRRTEKSCFARSCLWSKSVDGHVYIAYTISPQYSEVEERNIKRGMELIEGGTCVRFVPRTHQRDYLDIKPKSGCWSYLGVTGGRQVLSLQNPDCVGSAVVSHLLMHSLGFLHEQSRADRDKYITILWSNIGKDRHRNFEKFKTNNLDMPYDYGSIMHFGKYTYSQDGSPTVVPKRDWKVKLGQTFGPSELDIMKINKLYKCS